MKSPNPNDTINTYLENKLILTFVIGLSILFFAAFIVISRNGYGDNSDNYGMLRSWQEMIANGVYVPSRFQGNLPSEFINGTLASLFGPLGPNSFSLILSLSSLYLAFYFFKQVEPNWRKALLGVMIVAINPFWVNASSTSMDYIHPIPVFLLGILMLYKRWTVLAAVLFAIAGSIRISYAPMGLLALCWAWKRETGVDQKKVIVQALVVFAAVGCLLYVPVFISSHLRLTFLASARPLFQGFFGLVARWAYKLIYLYGFLAALFIFIIGGNILAGRSRLSSRLDPKSDLFFKVCLLVAVYHLALFLYIPAKHEYLFPLLIAVAGLFVVKRVPSALMAGLILAELSYWFVSIDFLAIEHKSTDPCAAVEAIGARIEPHAAQGVLIPALTNKTNELLCFPQLLLERPAIIQDRLPRPPVREP